MNLLDALYSFLMIHFITHRSTYFQYGTLLFIFLSIAPQGLCKKIQWHQSGNLPPPLSPVACLREAASAKAGERKDEG